MVVSQTRCEEMAYGVNLESGAQQQLICPADGGIQGVPGCDIGWC